MAFISRFFGSGATTAFVELGWLARLRAFFGFGLAKKPSITSSPPVTNVLREKTSSPASPPPSQSPAPPTPASSSPPAKEMHTSALAMVAHRVPMIRFVGARLPRPSYNSSALPPLQVTNTSVPSSSPSSSSSKASSIGPVGTIPRGQGIPESELPQRFRRQLISQEECDAINGGGAYP